MVGGVVLDRSEAAWPVPERAVSPDEEEARRTGAIDTLVRHDAGSTVDAYRSGDVRRSIKALLAARGEHPLIDAECAERMQGFPRGWTNPHAKIPDYLRPVGLEGREPLRVVSLCAGIGGLDLGMHLAGRWVGVPIRTDLLVELDPWLTETFLPRRFPSAEVASDLRADDTHEALDRHRGAEVLLAGFPCTPWSLAGGKRKAARGWLHREYLLPEVLSAVQAVEPAAILAENVSAFGRSKEFRRVWLPRLRDLGYDASWHVVPAAATGAWHRRERWICLAWHPERCRALTWMGRRAPWLDMALWPEVEMGAVETWEEWGRWDSEPHELRGWRHANDPSKKLTLRRVAALGGTVSLPVARAIGEALLRVMLDPPTATDGRLDRVHDPGTRSGRRVVSDPEELARRQAAERRRGWRPTILHNPDSP